LGKDPDYLRATAYLKEKIGMSQEIREIVNTCDPKSFFTIMSKNRIGK